MSGSVLWRVKALSWKTEDAEDVAAKLEFLYQEINQKTLDFEKDGKIASLENLRGAPVYVHNGSNDLVARRELVDLSEKFYNNLGANLKSVLEVGMAHEMPEDEPREVLKFLLGNLPKSRD